MAEIQRVSPMGATGVFGNAAANHTLPPLSLLVEGGTCQLSEKPFQSLLNIRGNGEDAGFVAAVQACLGLALPVRANSGSFNGSRQLLWLGPDEWLFKAEPDQAEALGTALRQALAGSHHAVVDVSSGYTTLIVEGDKAAQLINRGCPLDLHPKVFGENAVAQSHIAKAAVVLVCTQAGQRFEVTVRRSFTRYLRDWLSAAADF